MTIADLKKASKHEIAEALGNVTVINDLAEWFNQLNSEGHSLDIPTNLRYGKGATPGIYPSSACKKGGCMLKMYYECTQEVPAYRSIDFKLQGIFDIGSLYHEYIQTHLELMYGDQFEKEAKVRNAKLHTRGRADGLFTFSNVRFVLEIKTIKEGGSYGFEKVHSKPLTDHIRQAQIYMAILGIPFALILYWCKNTSEMKEHALVYDEKIWDEIRGPIEIVVDAAFNRSEEHRTPEGYPVPAAPGGNCRICDYEYSCPAKKDKRNARKTSRTERKAAAGRAGKSRGW